jgi:hypothetical protein
MRFKVVLLAALVLGSAGAARAQSVDDIIDKTLVAFGGRAALGKLTSRQTTGTMTVSTPGGDISGTIETLNQSPNKVRTLINLDLSAMGAGTVTIDQRFDGTTGFSLDSMRGNGPMPAAQADNLSNSVFPNPLMNYKDRGTKIVLGGKEKVGDRDAFALSITPTRGSVTRLFIDAETYLPLKSIINTEFPEVGPVEQTTEFSDYREVDGVKVPFRIKGSSAVQTFTVTVTKIEHNVKIDPALFTKPADK